VTRLEPPSSRLPQTSSHASLSETSYAHLHLHYLSIYLSICPSMKSPETPLAPSGLSLAIVCGREYSHLRCIMATATTTSTDCDIRRLHSLEAYESPIGRRPDWIGTAQTAQHSTPCIAHQQDNFSLCEEVRSPYMCSCCATGMVSCGQTSHLDGGVPVLLFFLPFLLASCAARRSANPPFQQHHPLSATA